MAQLPFPDPPLTDGVISLRAWTRGDLRFVVRACSDAEVSRFSPSIPFPYREADAVGWFEGQEPARQAGIAIDLAMAGAQADELRGAIGLHNVSAELGSAAMGYWLAPEARGGGSASRAVRLLANWAFDELRLGRLEITRDPDNYASQRVAARCGFRLEGRLRSHLRILHSGQRRDSLVYGLLPGELSR